MYLRLVNKWSRNKFSALSTLLECFLINQIMRGNEMDCKTTWNGERNEVSTLYMCSVQLHVRCQKWRFKFFLIFWFLLDSRRSSDQTKTSKQAFFYTLNIKAQVASLLKREFLTILCLSYFFYKMDLKPCFRICDS